MQSECTLSNVSSWAICCRCKVKSFQGRGKWAVSCKKQDKKQDFFPFPVAWLSRDSWQNVKCGPPRIIIFPIGLPVFHHFFLKIDIRKDIGALTDIGNTVRTAEIKKNQPENKLPLANVKKSGQRKQDQVSSSLSHCGSKL
ncbi:hypothetical protein AVEN_154954-1 [Araneus ventricosus]|uniref:Uncharacterized protein n=1 Tax=Araneus ventricosus TaxID=182803 RepID=A0A4Y2A893_ARAVE|nr:hypothetical protein AVEN_154954-1 [Araneus ventricosus]